MRFKRFHLSLIIVFLSGGFSASAQEVAKTGAKTAQSTLQEWVKTKQIHSRESAQWEEEQATLAQLNEIRTRELEQLKEFTAAARSRATELDKQISGFAEERESLKTWRRNLQSLVADWEKQIQASQAFFPPPLRDRIEESLLRVKEDNAERPLQQKTRDVLLISQAYLDFQNGFTVDSELREIEGETRSIDVLYLGLSKAWFVDASGRFSGYGAPAKSGWTWTTDNQIASAVREAIEVQERRSPPALVTLPLQQEVVE